MGIIQSQSAMALAKQIKDDGDVAMGHLRNLAQHYQTAKINIGKLLAHPSSDDSDKQKVAAELRTYLANAMGLVAIVEADAAALEAGEIPTAE